MRCDNVNRAPSTRITNFAKTENFAKITKIAKICNNGHKIDIDPIQVLEPPQREL